MSIRFHSSVLLTPDVKRLSNFYIHILGQEIQHDFGACLILHCGLSLWQASDELTIAAKLGYTSHSSGNKNLELCFETETFDADAERIRGANAPLLHEIIEEPWGQRTLRFYDPDGNLLELGESIPAFIQRHHASGLSPQAVAEKTGVPLESVLQLLNK
jgi:catechol 2,3-dioxygenase-like lactoylglutathione lyase family enzyme